MIKITCPAESNILSLSVSWRCTPTFASTDWVLYRYMINFMCTKHTWPRCLSISTHPSIHLVIHARTNLSIQDDPAPCPFTFIPIYLSIYLSVCLSIYLSIYASYLIYEACQPLGARWQLRQAHSIMECLENKQHILRIASLPCNIIFAGDWNYVTTPLLWHGCLLRLLIGIGE